MELIKKYKNHIILAAVLTIIAGLAEIIVYFNWEALRESPITIGGFLKINPIYNEQGSWIHNKLGIGYIRWLLLLENIFLLLLGVFIFRFVGAFTKFFSMGSIWSYASVFAIATSLYRLFTHISGRFTLDYIDLRRYIYDLPDFYLAVFMFTILLWLIPALIKYYRHRNRKVAGLGFIKKQIWDFKITGMFLKAAVIPESKWESEFEPWR